MLIKVHESTGKWEKSVVLLAGHDEDRDREADGPAST
jgi:hypothetical protein